MLQFRGISGGAAIRPRRGRARSGDRRGTGRLRLSDLAGRWHFARAIAGSQRAGATGTLTFSPAACGLVAEEDGWMHLPGQAPIRAGRRTLWREEAGLIAVAFADGRPFHRLDPANAQPEAVHDCPPDRYHVGYDFTRFPLWSSLWQVHGPAKDYTIRTAFARDAAVLAGLAVSVQKPGNERRDRNGA